MKLLYFLLFNFSISVATEYVDLGEFLNPKIQPIPTLNNLPHDIKMLIAEKIDISDIPNLIQTTPALYRFFKTHLNQKYLYHKEITKIKTLSYAQLNGDLDSPYKVVKLLKLLNRLYKYRYDMSFIDAERIALESSKLRFAPTFLILGGKTALKDFCSNYNIKFAHEPKLRSLLKSIRYDYSAIPILLIITYAITLILLIPYLVNAPTKFKLAEERFSHLPQYNSTTLTDYYTSKEIYAIRGCEKYWGKVFLSTYLDCNKYSVCNHEILESYLSFRAYDLVEYLLKKYNPYTIAESSIPFIDAFSEAPMVFIRATSSNYPTYEYNSGVLHEAKAIVFDAYYIEKKCLYSNNFNAVLGCSAFTLAITLIALIADKIYIAVKKKSQANLNIQNIYRNL